MKNRAFAFGIFLALLSGNAFAGDNTAQIKTAVDAINAMLTSISSSADTLASALITPGTTALKTIIAYRVVKEIFFTFLERDSSLVIFAKLIKLAIPVGLANWAITENKANLDTFQTFMDGLTSDFTGVVLRTNIASTLDVIFQTVTSLLCSATDSTSTSITGTLLDLKFAVWISLLIAYVWKAIAAMIIAIGGVFFVGDLIVSQYMITIGAAIGPLMIPFALLEPFSFLCSNWIRFMIKAGLVQVVGGVIFSIINGAFSKMSAMATAAQTYNDPSAILMAAFACVFIALFSRIMLQSTVKIASALMGGSISGISGSLSKEQELAMEAAALARGK